MQSARRRAAQAAAVLVIAAGAVALVTSLSPSLGPVVVDLLGAAFLSAAMVLVGRRLLHWGSGD